MVDCFEQKLIKYGYCGRVSDLIKYSGSIDGLIWYWENFLEKILINSKGFYGGAFIRFKIKTEAKKKYNSYREKLYSTEKNKLKEQQFVKEKINNIELYETKLIGWFVDYSLIDKCTQINDFKKYIWESGHFDFYSEYQKKEFLRTTRLPCYLKAPNRILFQEFICGFKEYKNY
jgi:hypothetical protein